ncbi:hypothetical protein H6G89_25050 [Oscillatoria sp. FACHB-1407]|uniref:hypothetical protein n=1 Tax=Oscillatoria sp. FACHB-1407 TaxID=2692847 RepID=UPI001684B5F9|nr:hypothetical protein [Oscillatoria sp. FACHB-1407]MBD2464277.1 hypothetical protein [Oscillatoria sp. FACHB-1407]
MGQKAIWIGSTIAFTGVVSLGLWLFSNLFVAGESSGTEAIAEFQHLTDTPAAATSALSTSNAHFLVVVAGIDPSFFFKFQTNQHFIDALVAQHQLELTSTDAEVCQDVITHGPIRPWWNAWMHSFNQCYVGYSNGDIYHLLFDSNSGVMFLYLADT